MRRLPPIEKARLARLARRRERKRVHRKLIRRLSIKARTERAGRNTSLTRSLGVPFSPHAIRYPILLPEEISLRTNFTQTVEVVQMLREAVLVRGEPVMLYFDRVRQIEPAALLLLAGEIFRCRNLRSSRLGLSVHGSYPADPDIRHQLRDMGFFRLLGVEDAQTADSERREERPYFVHMRSATGVDGEFAAAFCNLVLHGAFPMNDTARRRLVGALKEAMGNADEHAYKEVTSYPPMKGRWWLTGYVNPSQGEMMIILADQGIGIPRSLGPTQYERISSLLTSRTWQPSDGYMIAAATELHRTSTGQSGRGKGFRDMKRFIDTCDDGELRIISNSGAYQYMKGTETISDEAMSIGGTLIEWRVRHAHMVEVEDA